MRYFVMLVFFTLQATLLALSRRGPGRYLGAAVLATTLGLGIPGDFIDDRPYDTHYADQVAVFRTLPAGKSFPFIVVPMGFPRMVLKSRGGSGLPPWAGRIALSAPTYYLLSDPIIVPNKQGGDLRVEGVASDEPARKPSGGVFVLIDGRPFPAVTDLIWSEARRPEERHSAFRREIALSEIGPGRHELKLLILTHDRRAYFLPTTSITFEVPVFAGK